MRLHRIEYFEIPLILSKEFTIWLIDTLKYEDGSLFIGLSELRDVWENEKFYLKDKKKFKKEHKEEYEALCKYINRFKYKEISAMYY